MGMEVLVIILKKTGVIYIDITAFQQILWSDFLDGERPVVPD